MTKDTYNPVVVNRNEDVESASLLYLHGNNIKVDEKQEIVKNIEF